MGNRTNFKIKLQGSTSQNWLFITKKKITKNIWECNSRIWWIKDCYLMKDKKEIAVLLPNKEDYSLNNAAAASIWVKDYNRGKIINKQIVFIIYSLKNQYQQIPSIP